MIKVIGNIGCSRCEVVKGILNNKGVSFEYLLLSDLTDEYVSQIMNDARKKGIMSLPIIIKNDELITLEEV